MKNINREFYIKMLQICFPLCGSPFSLMKLKYPASKETSIGITIHLHTKTRLIPSVKKLTESRSVDVSRICLLKLHYSVYLMQPSTRYVCIY
jgi:hypothetical protein